MQAAISTCASLERRSAINCTEGGRDCADA